MAPGPSPAVANLLAHGVVALALYTAVSIPWTGEPLPAHGFVAAGIALLPDLELRWGRGRTPWGHSLGAGVLWLLTAISILGLGAAAGVVTGPMLTELLLAVGVGLLSHLGLDTVTRPGIWGLPTREGGWGSPWACLPARWAGAVHLLVSALSLGVLVLLLTLL